MIKTPKTVKQFRENLLKYVVSDSDKREIWVQFGSDEYDTKWISVDKLDSIWDLNKYGSSKPHVTFKINEKISPWDWKIENKESVIQKSMTGNPFVDYFKDTSNYEMIEDETEFLKSVEVPLWVNVHDYIYSELFVKVMGEFSGYKCKEEDYVQI